MKLPLLVFIPFCLVCCSAAVPETELIGNYTASYGSETATLSLMADHTYSHTVWVAGRQVAGAASTWKVSTVTASGVQATAVDLAKFVAIPSFRNESVGPGWVPEVDRTWLGRIRLCFDSDVGYCYVKQ